MNSPARMGAAGIKTCGKPFQCQSLKGSHVDSLIFPTTIAHLSLSLPHPLFPFKGSWPQRPWLRENRAREGQLIGKGCVHECTARICIIKHTALLMECNLLLKTTMVLKFQLKTEPEMHFCAMMFYYYTDAWTPRKLDSHIDIVKVEWNKSGRTANLIQKSPLSQPPWCWFTLSIDFKLSILCTCA